MEALLLCGAFLGDGDGDGMACKHAERRNAEAKADKKECLFEVLSSRNLWLGI